MATKNLVAVQQCQRLTQCPPGETGAVILGGDFSGLGIVRSLGRHGVPVCIIDDERSIAGYSRYATGMIRVANLRDEQSIISCLLAVGSRFGLKGWILYPTRDEIVAALSRYRSVLANAFCVPIPSWETLQWTCDKRNTYRLAQELDIPIPRTWYSHQIEDVSRIEADLPLVIKPAIKEHFIYATKVKAWRVDSRAELGVHEILRGSLGWREYARSLTDCHVEAVFTRDDPLPGLAELGLIPYLYMKRGY